MKRELFEDYYYRIERVIAKNAKGKNINDVGMKRINDEIYKCAQELTKHLLKLRLKKHPELKGKIDDNWLTWFSLALVAYSWSCAVARGKGFDRKRNMRGRLGWLEGYESLPEKMNVVYKISSEIVNERLFDDGDFDIEAQTSRLLKRLEPK